MGDVRFIHRDECPISEATTVCGTCLQLERAAAGAIMDDLRAQLAARDAALGSINAGIDAIERQAKMAEGNALGVMLSAAVAVLRDAAAHPTPESEPPACVVIADTWLLVNGVKHNWWCRSHRIGWDRKDERPIPPPPTHCPVVRPTPESED